LFHLPVLDLDIQGKHAWRQTQTMWNIKNFTELDPNILNPRVSHYNYGDTNIYRYEFPLMQWIIGMAQRVLGSNTVLVRILLFLFSVTGGIGLFRLLKRINVRTTAAFMGLLLYLFCPVIFYYMINPLPDNLALSAGIWYLYHIVSYQHNNRKRHLFLASISLLIATYHAKTMFPFLLLYPSVWIPFFVGLIFCIWKKQGLGWIGSLVGITFLYLFLQWDVIGTVHDYYLMPFLPWMYILVTLGIEKMLFEKSKVWQVVAILCFITAPLVSYHWTIDKWYAVWYNKDLYTHRRALIDAVPDDERCIMLRDMGKYVFPYQVNKRGYIYPNESLSGL